MVDLDKAEACRQMNSVKYTLKLEGLATPKGTISSSVLQTLLASFVEGSERALRLAIEGVSVKRGKTPSWLNQSVDFIVTGLKEGSTVLELESPTLGTVAPEQLKQEELWTKKPKPEETALSLFARALSSSLSSEDSDDYDEGVLDSVVKPLSKVFSNPDVKITLQGKNGRHESFTLDQTKYQQITNREHQFPEPQMIVVSGKFDMIEHSEHKFTLLLGDGLILRGTVDEAHFEEETYRSLWGAKVTVKGKLHSHPSGKPRILEADYIRSMQQGEEVLEQLNIIPRMLIQQVITSASSKRFNVNDIWGKWPGEETIQELLAALNEM